MFLKIETTSKKIMQPTTIKSKNNGCGTAPGNLVMIFNVCKYKIGNSKLIYLKIEDDLKKNNATQNN